METLQCPDRESERESEGAPTHTLEAEEITFIRFTLVIFHSVNLRSATHTRVNKQTHTHTLKKEIRGAKYRQSVVGLVSTVVAS